MSISVTQPDPPRVDLTIWLLVVTYTLGLALWFGIGWGIGRLVASLWGMV